MVKHPLEIPCGVTCQWESKSVPVPGIEKCTTQLVKEWGQSGGTGSESPPFWESCFAKA